MMTMTIPRILQGAFSQEGAFWRAGRFWFVRGSWNRDAALNTGRRLIVIKSLCGVTVFPQSCIVPNAITASAVAFGASRDRTQSVGFRIMQAAMIGTFQKLQIFWSIIKFVMVAMVNLLTSKQCPAKNRFHDNSMLKSLADSAVAFAMKRRHATSLTEEFRCATTAAN
jgi:hypothetical protein